MGLGLSALGWAVRPRTALGSLGVAGREGERGDVLVSVFLRGGADGLSLVAPYADDSYCRNRPTLALAGPRDARRLPADRVRDLDGFFGLHPALAPLYPLYESGQMAIVHACGSGDRTHSHFAAMATVERGIAQDTGPASGWLARHLGSAPGDNPSPLRAVALGALAPEALRGAPAATALRTAEDVKLRVPFPDRAPAVTRTLSALYGSEGTDPLLKEAGTEALSVLKKLRNLAPSRYRPSPGATYPQDDLGEGLRQTALLIKSGVGLEVACLDQNGYDTHVAQGTSQGALARLLGSLAAGLAAFATDLGPERWARTTVVALSEFGRRLAENSGAGTDHGRGGVLFVLGGRGIVGGRVHGAWPGLGGNQLEGPGDLKVTTDYRDVLAEVVARRLHNPYITEVFPGLAFRPVGVVYA
jgi:uncharacterized protein (DUF1501 family)